MASITGVELALTTGRCAGARMGLGRLAFAPRNTTNRNPRNGTIPQALRLRYYTWNQVYPPTTTSTTVLS